MLICSSNDAGLICGVVTGGSDTGKIVSITEESRVHVVIWWWVARGQRQNAKETTAQALLLYVLQRSVPEFVQKCLISDHVTAI